ncbi:MAG: CRTAC1 family protein [Myxococcota bacterium]
MAVRWALVLPLVAACGAADDGEGSTEDPSPDEGASLDGGACPAAEAPPACDPPTPEGAGAPLFRDDSAALGIDFVHHGDPKTENFIRLLVPGVCLFDFNGDGRLDLYFADTAGNPNRLYRNDCGGFTDVTEAMRVGDLGEGVGCLAFDYDNDADMDLYVTNQGEDRLLRNDGCRFTDVTAEAGISEPLASTSATAGDVDNDGDLDLFVGVSTRPPALFINDGAGAFHDEAAARGFVYSDQTLATLFVDFDADGDVDLFVGNDAGPVQPDRLYVNDGLGAFQDLAPAMGLAYDSTGDSADTMGVDVGDYDRDGCLDVAITNLSNRHAFIYDCDCSPTITCHEASAELGVAGPTAGYTNWGVGFVDMDQDADLDLFTASGLLGGAQMVPNTDQRNQLFWNEAGVFVEHAPEPSDALEVEQNSRGAAFGDIDGDGDLDVVVANFGQPPAVLRNNAASGHFLMVRLVGTSSNRQGVGALVTVIIDGRTLTEPAVAGGSYLGSSDPRVHFGLGDAMFADLVVAWPSGIVQYLSDLQADQFLTVVETAP